MLVLLFSREEVRAGVWDGKRGEPHGRLRAATTLAPLVRRTRRGGEKPRGRDESSRWHEGSEGLALAPGWDEAHRSENRRRGPREGDATKSTDGRCSEWPCFTAAGDAGIGFGVEGSTELGEGLGWSARWQHGAERGHGMEAVRDGGGTSRARDEASAWSREWKDLERSAGDSVIDAGSGEGQRLATAPSERQSIRSDPSSHHPNTTNCAAVSTVR